MKKTETPPYIEFERSLPHQVREMLDRNPVAYVPVGALEWHGEHCALGLDGIKAEYICRRAAERSGGVLFPVMSWNAFYTMKWPFTFSFPYRGFKRLLRGTLDSLVKWGFRSIVVLSGHYPAAMIGLLRRECRRISKRRGIGALGISEQALAVDMGYLGDHAAKWETSILMAIDSSLVDLSRLPDDTGSLWNRRESYGILGICPKKNASRELGAQVLEVIIERLTRVAQRMRDEGGSGAAEEVYAAHSEAFKNLIEAGRKAYGIDSAREIVLYTIKSILRDRHL